MWYETPKQITDRLVKLFALRAPPGVGDVACLCCVYRRDATAVCQDTNYSSNLEPIIIGSRFLKTQQQSGIIHRMFYRKRSKNCVFTDSSFQMQ